MAILITVECIVKPMIHPVTDLIITVTKAGIIGL